MLNNDMDLLILKTILVLHDEINKTIHRTTPPPAREIQLCIAVHGLEKHARGRGIVVPHYQYRPRKYQIPNSMLVQTFMRELREIA